VHNKHSFCAYTEKIIGINIAYIVLRNTIIGDRMTGYKTYEYLWQAGYKPESSIRR